MLYPALLVFHIFSGVATLGLCVLGLYTALRSALPQSLLNISQRLLLSVAAVMISGFSLLWLQLATGNVHGACAKLAIYLAVITLTEGVVAIRYVQLTKPALLVLPFRAEGLAIISSWVMVFSVAQVVGW